MDRKTKKKRDDCRGREKKKHGKRQGRVRRCETKGAILAFVKAAKLAKYEKYGARFLQNPCTARIRITENHTLAQLSSNQLRAVHHGPKWTEVSKQWILSIIIRYLIKFGSSSPFDFLTPSSTEIPLLTTTRSPVDQLLRPNTLPPPL